jgi:hypothetical protein
MRPCCPEDGGRGHVRSLSGVPPTTLISPTGILLFFVFFLDFVGPVLLLYLHCRPVVEKWNALVWMCAVVRQGLLVKSGW